MSDLSEVFPSYMSKSMKDMKKIIKDDILKSREIKDPISLLRSSAPSTEFRRETFVPAPSPAPMLAPVPMLAPAPALSARMKEEMLDAFFDNMKHINKMYEKIIYFLCFIILALAGALIYKN
jgi:hypothetical protein